MKSKNTTVLKTFTRRPDSSAIIATVVLIVVFCVLAPQFLSAFNIFNVTRSAAQNVFIALAQAMVVIIGGMNLAIGSIGGLTVVVVGYCIEVLNLPPAVAVVFGLITGLLAGVFNGLIISRFKLNSFVVTLATSFIFTGLLNGISKGTPYSKIPESFTVLGKGNLGGIPLLFILMIAALLIVHFVFKYTELGRNLLATGGNETAARMSGINTSRMIMLANILSGVLASLAGILWISRVGTAQPLTGQDWLIVSFAVTVIGGTSLSGGVISPLGFVFSGLLMALIRNGLIMVGVNVYLESMFLGIIILLAVLVDYFRMRLIVSGK